MKSFILSSFGVLLIFFWKSFIPGQVLFSNDGPLGEEVRQYRGIAIFSKNWPKTSTNRVNIGMPIYRILDNGHIKLIGYNNGYGEDVLIK